VPRRPRGSRLGGSSGVPVLVPVRASPVPSVVRGSFVVKFFCAAGLKRKIRGTQGIRFWPSHSSCYEVVMLAVITTSGRCCECYEVL